MVSLPPVLELKDTQLSKSSDEGLFLTTMDPEMQMVKPEAFIPHHTHSILYLLLFCFFYLSGFTHKWPYMSGIVSYMEKQAGASAKPFATAEAVTAFIETGNEK